MNILSHIIHSYDTLSLQRNKKKSEVSNVVFKDESEKWTITMSPGYVGMNSSTLLLLYM